MRINVTHAHINQGRRHNCRACPIALALSDLYGDGAADVGLCHIEVWTDWGMQSCLLPEIARTFIRDFDQANPVAPFTFDLPIGDPAHAPTD